MREVHVLSLGAGVQSTTLYLLALDGAHELCFDAAIFADTQDEPGHIYAHLNWLRSLAGPPIIVRTAGRLGDDLIFGRNSTGQRFPGRAIPAYTATIPAYSGAIPGQPLGKGRRQCTREYKIDVIERAVRRDVLGLAPRRRIPKDTVVHQYIGISQDEARRAMSIRERFASSARKGVPHFPLLDMGWTRGDCVRYLRARVPHPVGRSACVFCPLKSDREWLLLKEHDPEGWARAIQIDEALRQSGTVMIRSMRAAIYLHRSGKPLASAPLRGEGQGEFPYFATECEGACGV